MTHLRPRIVLALSLGAACSPAPTPHAPDAATVPGTFTFGDFMSSVGIEHLEVCLMDTDNCDITDADGCATLSLPAESDIAITVVGDIYAPTLMPLATGTEELVIRNFLAPSAIYELGAAAAGLTIDDGLGSMVISMVDTDFQPAAGYSATLSCGEGPYYLNDVSVAIDLEAEATTAAGRVLAINIDCDTLHVTFEGPGTCAPRGHYWNRGPNLAVMPILPGFISGVMMECG